MPTIPPDFSAGWPAVSDSLIGGIAHALSNRIATLAALAELMRMDDDVAANAEMLRTEVGRLEALVRALRLLGTEGEVSPEALDMPELLGEAIALHRHHRDLRDVAIVVEEGERPRPVRAARARLAQALLMLLAHAASTVDDPEMAVHARFGGNGRHARLTLTTPGAAEAMRSPALLDAAAALVAPAGGTVASTGNEIVLDLPALGSSGAART